MGPGFRVDFSDAVKAHTTISKFGSARRLADDLEVSKLPLLTRYADVTDAYLVELARANGLLFATLDDALCVKSWAAGVAFNPLAQTAPAQ